MTDQRTASILPMVIRAPEVARLMGHSAGWFYGHRAELEKQGFPPKDGLLGGWHKAAVTDWLARRGGVIEQLALDEEREAGRAAIREQAQRRRNALRHR